MSSDYIMNRTRTRPVGTAVGRGGHGGGGHGGGGWHGGGQPRRYFNNGGDSYYWDGGYGWPYDAGDVNVYVLPPSQGAPMNSYDPYSIMESSPPGLVPTLPAGTQVKLAGSIPQSYARSGELAAVAPVLAPGTNGYSFRVDLDANGQLHGAICIDGKRYQAVFDARPVLAQVMQKFAAYHQNLHQGMAMAPTSVAGEVLGAEVDAEVGACSRALIRGLVERHCDTVSAGFFDDIAGAVTGAIKGVGGGISSAVGTIGHTLNELKGPIGQAASLAAGAAALAIPGVGPIVAPIAKNLADQLVKAATGDPNAKQAVAAATAQAKTDPNVAKALKVAHTAVAHTTAHHHVVRTVRRAATGDIAARQQVQKIAMAAKQGDPAAQQAMTVAQNATTAAETAQAAQMPTTAVPFDGMMPDIASAIDAMNTPAPTDAAAAQATTQAAVSGILPMVLFVSAGLAGYAWWRLRRTKIDAARAIDTAAKADAAPPGPEKTALVKKTIDITETVKASSPPAAPGEQPPEADGGWGALDPFSAAHGNAAGAPGTAGASATVSAGAFVGTGGPWVTIIGAARDTVRQEASDFARRAPERVLGVMRKADDHQIRMAFDSSDDADDWMGRQDPSEYVYIAYYDKGSMAWPENELWGTQGTSGVAASAPGSAIHRGIATSQGWL